MLQILLIVVLFLMTGPLSISLVAYFLQLKRLWANADAAAPAAATQAAQAAGQ